MRGAGFGHGGAVGDILDALPLDTTFHVTDCGLDDNDRCGCYDLPAKLRRIVDQHAADAVRAALAEAADRIEAAGCCDEPLNAYARAAYGTDHYARAARIVRNLSPDG